VEADRIFYGVGRLDLHLPYCRSLKDKRSILNSLKNRLAERARVAVIDVGPQDLWQRGTLGICLVARDDAQVRQALSSLVHMAEDEDGVLVLSFRTRTGSLGDEFVDDDGDDFEDEEGEEG
jgi:uncharacterized protein